MSFFKSLFSSDDIIKTGVDAIIKSGDALVYTDEEKAEAKAKQQEWYLELMKAVSPSAKSRRAVAWIITGMVALLSIAATVCQLFGMTEQAKWMLQLLADVWVYPFTGVVVFYFGKGILK